MKIAITGASGYIGRHIAALAKKNGHEVVAIDRSSDIDIFAQHDNIFEALQKPDVLLHLAWRDGFRHNSPEHMKNLSHHYDFLRSYINSGGKNVAVMGSMHEVGYWEGAIDEQTPCDPLATLPYIGCVVFISMAMIWAATRYFPKSHKLLLTVKPNFLSRQAKINMIFCILMNFRIKC